MLLEPNIFTVMKVLSFSFTVLALGTASVLATPFGVSARKKTTLQAAAKPLYFGAALGQGHLQNTSDTMFKKLAKQQFSGATPENEMKWLVTYPRSFYQRSHAMSNMNGTKGDYRA